MTRTGGAPVPAAPAHAAAEASVPASRPMPARPRRRAGRRSQRWRAWFRWRKLRFRFDWTLTAVGGGGRGAGPAQPVERGARPQLAAVHAAGLVARAGRRRCSWPWPRLDYRTHQPLRRTSSTASACRCWSACLAFGKMVGGGRRWFDLGPAAPAAVGDDAGADHRGAGQVPERFACARGAILRHLAIPVVIVSLPALLIAKQPDFGTAFLFLLIFITIMLTARLKLKTLAAIMGLAAIAAFPIIPAPAARVPAQALRLLL